MRPADPDASPLAALPALGAPTGARGTREQKTITAKAGGLRMGYTVYLPPGYSQNPDQRYPVVYHLHGCGYTPSVDEFVASFERGLQQRVIWPMIAIFPQQERGGSGCPWWRDGTPDQGRAYGALLLDELVSAVDSIYRTLADRRFRVVHGMSAGGVGALYHGTKNPDVLSVAVAYDAPIGHPPVVDLMRTDGPVVAARKNAQVLRSGSFFRAINGQYAPWMNAFLDPMKELDIPVDYVVHRDCEHKYSCFLQREGLETWKFIVRSVEAQATR